MNDAQYLIAKYIPDLQRSEPRNIGVILWTPAGLAARFLAENRDDPGIIDGRRIPGFVTSTSAYRQWIEFWRSELCKPETTATIHPGKKASRESDAFLEVLAESSKGNFVLTPGGRLLDTVSDIQDAVDYLFDMLVEAPTADEPRDATLDELCERVIERVNIRKDPNFRENFDVPCMVTNQVSEKFNFSYGYQNGSLKRLYHRVPLLRARSPQRKTLHDAAWTFEKVVAAKIIAKEDLVALVHYPLEREQTEEVKTWFSLLGTYSRVLNLSNQEDAINEFQALPALANH